MLQIICQFEHEGRKFYFDWSTVLDAPISHAMPLSEYVNTYESEFGRMGTEELVKRIKRADANGTSSVMHSSLADLIEGNRAGDDEASLLWDELKLMLLSRERLLQNQRQHHMQPGPDLVGRTGDMIWTEE